MRVREPTAIEGHSSRRRSRADRLGVVLAVVGAASVGVGMGFRWAAPRVPRLGVFAGFALVLLGVIAVGALIAGLRRRGRSRPAGVVPWMDDHHWDAGGYRVTPWNRIRRPTRWLGFAFGSALVLLGGSIVLGARALTASSAIVAGAGAVGWVYFVHERLWFGTTYVRYVDPPYRPGARAEIRFGVSAKGGSFQRIAFRLIRVQERTKDRAPPNRPPVPHLVHVVPQSEEQTPLGPGDETILHFEIPQDAACTRLDSDLPTYWELEVEGDTSCGAFREWFLVPVYEPV